MKIRFLHLEVLSEKIVAILNDLKDFRFTYIFLNELITDKHGGLLYTIIN